MTTPKNCSKRVKFESFVDDDVETSKGRGTYKPWGIQDLLRKKEIMMGWSRTKKNMKEKSQLDDNQTKKERQSRDDDEQLTKPNR